MHMFRYQMMTDFGYHLNIHWHCYKYLYELVISSQSFNHLILPELSIPDVTHEIGII